MRILYLAPGDHLDYQSDVLLIGLKEAFGADVVDANDHTYLYDSFPAEQAACLYGKGMTITRTLPHLEVDRTDIAQKIRTRYFDLVVYGSVWRCQDYLDQVLASYPPKLVALVDGEDAPTLHPLAGLRSPYFKRELAVWLRGPGHVAPIGFAIPTSKLNFGAPKTRLLAHCDPRDRSTYIYDTEAAYYQGYAESCYAVTVKKAGWDCMRHYEIVANGAIPLFLDIADCPDATMSHFPKVLCQQILARTPDERTYVEYSQRFEEYTRAHLTTKALCARFLSTLAAG